MALHRPGHDTAKQIALVDATAVREARRALVRLRRAVLKAERELGSVERAMQTADEDGHALGAYDSGREALTQLIEFIGQEEHRVNSLILRAGGLRKGASTNRG